MKANELRIGSILNNAGGKTINCTAQTISDFESGLIILKPIPLTEEWLLKFGFEITKQTKEDNNIWTFIGSECKFELEQITKFHLYDNMCFGTEVKYVHQLQNLYFALTGEELTLSE